MLTPGRLRTGLIVALAALGVLAVSDLTVILAVAVDLRDGTTSQVLTTANEYARVDIQDRRRRCCCSYGPSWTPPSGPRC